MQSVLVRPQTVVVRPQGHVNAANASTLQDQLTIVVKSEQTSALLVDMQNVESLDSAGLMVLVSTLSLAQRQHKRFSLCSISASIRIIFELTQLDDIFEIFEDSAAFEATIAE